MCSRRTSGPITSAAILILEALPHKCGVPASLGTPHLCGSEASNRGLPGSESQNENWYLRNRDGRSQAQSSRPRELAVDRDKIGRAPRSPAMPTCPVRSPCFHRFHGPPRPHYPFPTIVADKLIVAGWKTGEIRRVRHRSEGSPGEQI